MKSPVVASFIAGIAVPAVVAGIGGYAAVMGGLIPVNADARPGKLETFIAKHALHAAILRQDPTDLDPVEASSQNLLAGLSRYKHDCAVCHGMADAKASDVAKGLYQRPPQLGKDGVEDDPPGMTYWKIAHGIRMTGMPAFAPSLNSRQIWELVTFLKHMNHLPPAAEAGWKHPSS